MTNTALILIPRGVVFGFIRLLSRSSGVLVTSQSKDPTKPGRRLAIYGVRAWTRLSESSHEAPFIE
jgi:hypothetical protein